MDDMLRFMKKYKYQIIIALIIALICIPLGIHILFSVAAPFDFLRAKWTAGDVLSFYGTIIGALCTILGVFLSIQYAQKNYKEDTEKRVLPYIGVTMLDVKNKNNIFNVLSYEDNSEDCNTYEEFLANKCCFTVDKDIINYRYDLSKRQKKLVMSGGMEETTDRNGVKILKHNNILSIPFMLQSVGNGPAICCRIGLHTQFTKWDHGKYFPPKYFSQGESFHVCIFFEDISSCEVGQTFYLRVAYENIYGDTYFQEYKVIVKEGNKVEIDLKGKQEKV